MAGTRNVRLIVTLCHNQNRRPEQAIDKEIAKTEPRLGRMRRQRSSHQAKSQGMLVQRNPKHPACQARRSVERKSFSLLLSPFNRLSLLFRKAAFRTAIHSPHVLRHPD